jgi:hypothetical protein
MGWTTVLVRGRSGRRAQAHRRPEREARRGVRGHARPLRRLPHGRAPAPGPGRRAAGRGHQEVRSARESTGGSVEGVELADPDSTPSGPRVEASAGHGRAGDERPAGRKRGAASRSRCMRATASRYLWLLDPDDESPEAYELRGGAYALAGRRVGGARQPFALHGSRVRARRSLAVAGRIAGAHGTSRGGWPRRTTAAGYSPLVVISRPPGRASRRQARPKS